MMHYDNTVNYLFLLVLGITVLEAEIYASQRNKCLGDGIFPDLSDCTRFYMCSAGKKTLFQCPAQLRFNPDILVCDWPINVICLKDIPTEGQSLPQKIAETTTPGADLISKTAHVGATTQSILPTEYVKIFLYSDSTTNLLKEQPIANDVTSTDFENVTVTSHSGTPNTSIKIEITEETGVTEIEAIESTIAGIKAANEDIEYPNIDKATALLEETTTEDKTGNKKRVTNPTESDEKFFAYVTENVVHTDIYDIEITRTEANEITPATRDQSWTSNFEEDTTEGKIVTEDILITKSCEMGDNGTNSDEIIPDGYAMNEGTSEQADAEYEYFIVNEDYVETEMWIEDTSNDTEITTEDEDIKTFTEGLVITIKPIIGRTIEEHEAYITEDDLTSLSYSITTSSYFQSNDESLKNTREGSQGHTNETVDINHMNQERMELDNLVEEQGYINTTPNTEPSEDEATEKLIKTTNIIDVLKKTQNVFNVQESNVKKGLAKSTLTDERDSFSTAEIDEQVKTETVNEESEAGSKNVKIPENIIIEQDKVIDGYTSAVVEKLGNLKNSRKEEPGFIKKDISTVTETIEQQTSVPSAKQIIDETKSNLMENVSEDESALDLAIITKEVDSTVTEEIVELLSFPDVDHVMNDEESHVMEGISEGNEKEVITVDSFINEGDFTPGERLGLSHNSEKVVPVITKDVDLTVTEEITKGLSDPNVEQKVDREKANVIGDVSESGVIIDSQNSTKGDIVKELKVLMSKEKPDGAHLTSWFHSTTTSSSLQRDDVLLENSSQGFQGITNNAVNINHTSQKGIELGTPVAQGEYIYTTYNAIHPEGAVTDKNKKPTNVTYVLQKVENVFDIEKSNVQEIATATPNDERQILNTTQVAEHVKAETDKEESEAASKVKISEDSIVIQDKMINEHASVAAEKTGKVENSGKEDAEIIKKDIFTVTEKTVQQTSVSNVKQVFDKTKSNLMENVSEDESVINVVDIKKKIDSTVTGDTVITKDVELTVTEEIARELSVTDVRQKVDREKANVVGGVSDSGVITDKQNSTEGDIVDGLKLLMSKEELDGAHLTSWFYSITTTSSLRRSDGSFENTREGFQGSTNHTVNISHISQERIELGTPVEEGGGEYMDTTYNTMPFEGAVTEKSEKTNIIHLPQKVENVFIIENLNEEELAKATINDQRGSINTTHVAEHVKAETAQRESESGSKSKIPENIVVTQVKVINEVASTVVEKSGKIESSGNEDAVVMKKDISTVTDEQQISVIDEMVEQLSPSNMDRMIGKTESQLTKGASENRDDSKVVEVTKEELITREIDSTVTGEMEKQLSFPDVERVINKKESYVLEGASEDREASMVVEVTEKEELITKEINSTVTEQILEQLSLSNMERVIDKNELYVNEGASDDREVSTVAKVTENESVVFVTYSSTTKDDSIAEEGLRLSKDSGKVEPLITKNSTFTKGIAKESSGPDVKQTINEEQINVVGSVSEIEVIGDEQKFTKGEIVEEIEVLISKEEPDGASKPTDIDERGDTVVDKQKSIFVSSTTSYENEVGDNSMKSQSVIPYDMYQEADSIIADGGSIKETFDTKRGIKMIISCDIESTSNGSLANVDTVNTMKESITAQYSDYPAFIAGNREFGAQDIKHIGLVGEKTTTSEKKLVSNKGSAERNVIVEDGTKSTEILAMNTRAQEKWVNTMAVRENIVNELDQLEDKKVLDGNNPTSVVAAIGQDKDRFGTSGGSSIFNREIPADFQKSDKVEVIHVNEKTSEFPSEAPTNEKSETNGIKTMDSKRDKYSIHMGTIDAEREENNETENILTKIDRDSLSIAKEKVQTGKPAGEVTDTDPKKSVTFMSDNSTNEELDTVLTGEGYIVEPVTKTNYRGKDILNTSENVGDVFRTEVFDTEKAKTIVHEGNLAVVNESYNIKTMIAAVTNNQEKENTSTLGRPTSEIILKDTSPINYGVILTKTEFDKEVVATTTSRGSAIIVEQPESIETARGKVEFAGTDFTSLTNNSLQNPVIVGDNVIHLDYSKDIMLLGYLTSAENYSVSASEGLQGIKSILRGDTPYSDLDKGASQDNILMSGDAHNTADRHNAKLELGFLRDTARSNTSILSSSGNQNDTNRDDQISQMSIKNSMQAIKQLSSTSDVQNNGFQDISSPSHGNEDVQDKESLPDGTITQNKGNRYNVYRNAGSTTERAREQSIISSDVVSQRNENKYQGYTHADMPTSKTGGIQEDESGQNQNINIISENHAVQGSHSDATVIPSSSNIVNTADEFLKRDTNLVSTVSTLKAHVNSKDKKDIKNETKKSYSKDESKKKKHELNILLKDEKQKVISGSEKNGSSSEKKRCSSEEKLSKKKSYKKKNKIGKNQKEENQNFTSEEDGKLSSKRNSSKNNTEKVIGNKSEESKRQKNKDYSLPSSGEAIGSTEYEINFKDHSTKNKHRMENKEEKRYSSSEESEESGANEAISSKEESLSSNMSIVNSKKEVKSSQSKHGSKIATSYNESENDLFRYEASESDKHIKTQRSSSKEQEYTSFNKVEEKYKENISRTQKLEKKSHKNKHEEKYHSSSDKSEESNADGAIGSEGGCLNSNINKTKRKKDKKSNEGEYDNKNESFSYANEIGSKNEPPSKHNDPEIEKYTDKRKIDNGFEGERIKLQGASTKNDKYKQNELAEVTLREDKKNKEINDRKNRNCTENKYRDSSNRGRDRTLHDDGGSKSNEQEPLRDKSRNRRRNRQNIRDLDEDNDSEGQTFNGRALHDARGSESNEQKRLRDKSRNRRRNRQNIRDLDQENDSDGHTLNEGTLHGDRDSESNEQKGLRDKSRNRSRNRQNIRGLDKENDSEGQTFKIKARNGDESEERLDWSEDMNSNGYIRISQRKEVSVADGDDKDAERINKNTREAESRRGRKSSDSDRKDSRRSNSEQSIENKKKEESTTGKAHKRRETASRTK